MGGVPLCQLEAAFLKRTDRLGQCEHARHFVSRILPDLAFMTGLPARLLSARAKQVSASEPLTTVLATLGVAARRDAIVRNCLRLGSIAAAGSRAWPLSRQAFEAIRHLALTGSPTEDFEVTLQRMRSAEAASMFEELENFGTRREHRYRLAKQRRNVSAAERSPCQGRSSHR